jgi:hypothetical protein
LLNLAFEANADKSFPILSTFRLEVTSYKKMLGWFLLLGDLHLKPLAGPGLTTCKAVMRLCWAETNRLHRLLDLISDPAV